MAILTAEKLIIAFKKLSQFLASPDEDFRDIIFSARNNNAWFTEQEVSRSLNALSEMLNEDDLHTWFKGIDITAVPKNRINLSRKYSLGWLPRCNSCSCNWKYCPD